MLYSEKEKKKKICWRESERFGSKRKEKQRKTSVSKPRLFEEFDQKC